MVDIHSHILWGVDDGSRSLEESLEMVRQAREDGTTDIVATPHASPQFQFQPDLVAERIATLQQQAGSGIRIHRGCDFHLYLENIEDAIRHPAKYAINGTPYLLVEFPDFILPKTFDPALHNLHAAGLVPIITHPERNAILMQKLETLREWVVRGCLIQVTAGSLLGRFGRRAERVAHQLVKDGLAHVVASDAHDTRHRTTRLRDAYAEVESRYGRQKAELLFRLNPQAIIEGDNIYFEETEAAARPRKWYQFWR